MKYYKNMYLNNIKSFTLEERLFIFLISPKDINRNYPRVNLQKIY